MQRDGAVERTLTVAVQAGLIRDWSYTALVGKYRLTPATSATFPIVLSTKAQADAVCAAFASAATVLRDRDRLLQHYYNHAHRMHEEEIARYADRLIRVSGSTMTEEEARERATQVIEDPFSDPRKPSATRRYLSL